MENWKQPQGLNYKGRREKEEDLKSIKIVNKGNANSATPQLDTWQCSGEKGHPEEHNGVQEVLGPHGEKAVPLLEGHLVETVEATWSQQIPENSHILWCWNKVLKGEAWCQMCVVIFHSP